MLTAAVTALFPLIAFLPRAVLSTVIMVVAVQHIDPWTKRSIARLMEPKTPQRSVIALDLGVALFVSVVSIAFNVVLAVFIGIAASVILFVLRMGRSNIRRLYRCDTMRSRKLRDAEDMAQLEAMGGSVPVLELQGALFFGSAERLARIVEREIQTKTSHIILGLRRVTEIDSTGAHILGDIDAALTPRKIKLALVRSDDSETAAPCASLERP
jgi:MFS superfamily sulfate permease-like transporter